MVLGHAPGRALRQRLEPAGLEQLGALAEAAVDVVDLDDDALRAAERRLRAGEDVALLAFDVDFEQGDGLALVEDRVEPPDLHGALHGAGEEVVGREPPEVLVALFARPQRRVAGHPRVGRQRRVAVVRARGEGQDGVGAAPAEPPEVDAEQAARRGVGLDADEPRAAADDRRAANGEESAVRADVDDEAVPRFDAPDRVVVACVPKDLVLEVRVLRRRRARQADDEAAAPVVEVDVLGARLVVAVVVVVVRRVVRHVPLCETGLEQLGAAKCAAFREAALERRAP